VVVQQDMLYTLVEQLVDQQSVLVSVMLSHKVDLQLEQVLVTLKQAMVAQLLVLE